jgi:nucleotide-binding universal stress UspA family protein
MTEILVGIDGSAGTQDALAFATRFARTTGAGLRLASAYPYEDRPSRASSPEYAVLLERETRAMLDRIAATLDGDDVVTHVIADMSPPRALHLLAEQTRAALIVVGSTRRGAVGRVVPGSTGERLLHGSPCLVAIVPLGYEKQADAPVTVVGVGYDGSEESDAALAAAYGAARRFAASLRVVRVFDATQVGTPAPTAGAAHVSLRKELETMQREQLERVVAGLPDDLGAEAIFLIGRPGREIAAQSESVDLMILGSRGYGPTRAVLLGGVTHAVVREAACPVIVLPRGSAHAGLDLMFATAAEASSQ